MLTRPRARPSKAGRRSAWCAAPTASASCSRARRWRWSPGAASCAPTCPQTGSSPRRFSGATAGLLVKQLRDVGVLGEDERIDAFRLASFQQVIALLPYFREEEAGSRPAPAPKVVFTGPDGVKLPDEASHLQRSGPDRGARPSDLRHSFVSLRIREGASIVEVARQAGHAPTIPWTPTDTSSRSSKELSGSLPRPRFAVPARKLVSDLCPSRAAKQTTRRGIPL